MTKVVNPEILAAATGVNRKLKKTAGKEVPLGSEPKLHTEAGEDTEPVKGVYLECED